MDTHADCYFFFFLLSFLSNALQLHVVIALSKYYNHLRREKSYGAASGGAVKDHTLQRIYLLPTPTSTTFPPINYNHHPHHHHHHHTSVDLCRQTELYYHDDPSSADDNVLVYAPIPLSRLSVEEAKEMRATEAWISSPVQHAASPSTTSSNRGHGHRHHRHHSHSGVKQHRHKSSSSVSAVPPYSDEAEEPFGVAEKAV